VRQNVAPARRRGWVGTPVHSCVGCLAAAVAAGPERDRVLCRAGRLRLARAQVPYCPGRWPSVRYSEMYRNRRNLFPAPGRADRGWPVWAWHPRRMPYQLSRNTPARTLLNIFQSVDIAPTVPPSHQIFFYIRANTSAEDSLLSLRKAGGRDGSTMICESPDAPPQGRSRIHHPDLDTMHVDGRALDCSRVPASSSLHLCHC